MVTDGSENRLDNGGWISKLVQPGDFKKSDYEFSFDRRAWPPSRPFRVRLGYPEWC
jgi:hypothetical protein